MKKYTRLRIEITGKCNLLCKYCYNEKFNSSKVSSNELSFKEIKKLIEEGMALGINNVLLIGGEPLLHPEIIKILDYIKNKKLSLSITSNGTIVSNSISDTIGSLNIANVILFLLLTFQICIA
jgi:molybdenum cofactor biosynthesis enzyme MoaA